MTCGCYRGWWSGRDVVGCAHWSANCLLQCRANTSRCFSSALVYFWAGSHNITIIWENSGYRAFGLFHQIWSHILPLRNHTALSKTSTVLVEVRKMLFLFFFKGRLAELVPLAASTGSLRWPSRTGKPRCPWRSPGVATRIPGRPPGWPAPPQTHSLPLGGSWGEESRQIPESKGWTSEKQLLTILGWHGRHNVEYLLKKN